MKPVHILSYTQYSYKILQILQVPKNPTNPFITSLLAWLHLPIRHQMGHFRRGTSNKNLWCTTWEHHEFEPYWWCLYITCPTKGNKNPANLTKPSLLWIHFTTSKVFGWQYFGSAGLFFGKPWGFFSLGFSLLGPGWRTHLGTWTNLLGGWELDKVLHTENPNPCILTYVLLVDCLF